MSSIRNLLNRITMYRLTLYVLSTYVLIAILLSFTGALSFNPVNIFLQTTYLIALCYLVNKLLSKLFGAVTNIESSIITALILTLIMGPVTLQKNIILLSIVGVIAMASKYFIAVHKRHIFNPAALAILLVAIFGGQGASWWIGNSSTLPFILLGGFLILVKIKRFSLVTTFLATYALLSLLLGRNPTNILLFSPIFFFSTIMLTEPLTSPKRYTYQIAFGGFVGLLFVSSQYFLKAPYGLELSLVLGNVFTYILEKPIRVVMKLVEKKKVANKTFSFYFNPEKYFDFEPGQFMYWTLPHKNADKKGIRRYFTIASSPTKDRVMITVRIPEKKSSFKKALKSLGEGEEIIAMDPTGDFTLPDDKSIPLCFIAGGIGVTPFISMAQSMIDKEEKRDIVLLYSNSTKKDVAFKDLLKKAKDVGIKAHFVVTKEDGYIDEEKIKKLVPNWKERAYFVSGPQPMVDIFEKMLSKMKVKKIKTDFFPGYTEKHQE